MCKGKSEGGRRCTAHSVEGYKKAINNKTAKNKDEKVKEKARDILLTPNADKPFVEKGNSMITAAKQKASNSAKRLSSLKTIKENRVMLADNQRKHYEHAGMTNSEAEEYDKLQTETERENWYNSKLKETEESNAVIEKEWRENPLHHYDRVAQPSEHEHMLSDKTVDSAYIKCIAVTTTDKAIRNRALSRLAKEQGVSKEILENAYATNIEPPKRNNESSQESITVKRLGFFGTIKAMFSRKEK